MTPELYKVIEAIANDLLALSVLVLESDNISNNTKTGRNTLADSALRHDLYTEITQDGDGSAVVTALFNNYVVYLEWDRPPGYGKPPPISALKDWAEKNGIPTDTQTLYAISYAIWRDGHTGRPIFATLDKEIEKMFNEEWSDKIFEALLKELNF